VISTDNPIRQAKDDLLSRSAIAEAFARQVLELDATEGFVAGILGDWGSGKTSFINLARHGFENADVPVLDFNPWMFSGAEQLVASFFIELAAQLKLRPDLVEVGTGLAEYGEAFSGLAWIPVVGPWAERIYSAAKVANKVLRRRSQGLGGKRAKLEEALLKLRRPIVVVLDDIDRLETKEIRDVFRLVRLTASLPSVIYLVAFDRKRVENALSEQGVLGRDYLEKILQLAFDLPTIPESLLTRQIPSAIDDALAGIDNPGQLDGDVWPAYFAQSERLFRAI